MAQDFTSEMKRTAEHAAGQGYSEIEELRRQVKDLTDKYGSMAQQSLQGARQTVQHNVSELEHQIRDRPIQSTLIAAGVGFLIGAIVFR